jgi:hypothetical protein
MSSARAIDLFLRVRGWDRCLEKAFPEEIEPWTAKRDRELKKFKAAMAKVTKEEFLRGRWGNTPMEIRLAHWREMVDRATGTKRASNIVNVV